MNTTSTLSPAQLVQRLHWRYATKQYDPSRKLPDETWKALEDSLVLSASSGGLQPWAFVVVTDPAVREKLLPAAYNQSQIRDASHLVVFAAKTQIGEAEVEAFVQRTAQVRNVPVESLSGLRGMLLGGIVQAKDPSARLAWAARQTYIALGTLLTSAAVLGVDATPMEGLSNAQFDEILGLKQRGLTTTVACTLGYRAADDKYATAPKVRFAKSDLIHYV